MVRASTVTQQIEDQHREMVRFCISEGYKEEDLIFVEDKGASAIKLNDSYQVMIDQVKEELSINPDIDCFAVWELSRAFRNELVFQQVKQILLQKKVQFLVKQPYLKLLNPDGTVNSGMEVAVSLMAVLAKQEMELKQERFKRAKSAMRTQGKYTGGHTIKYGYMVDNGYIVINPDTAPIVRTIFSLYSTGNFSQKSLYNELTERGYNIKYSLIYNIISNPCYVDGTYPQMISQELWDKCVRIRKRNNLDMPKGGRHYFATGIFYCPVCGKRMLTEGLHYKCWHHNKYSPLPHCPNSLTTQMASLDGLLWFVAQKEEIKYQMQMDRNREKEYKEKIDVLNQKIIAIQEKVDVFEYKKSKIVDTYLEDLITKEERDRKINKLKKDNQEYLDTILKYREQINSLTAILENKDNGVDMDYLASVYGGVVKESDLKVMKDIIHRHITRITAIPVWFGKFRNRRAIKENAQLITINTASGKEQRYVYIPNKYKGYNFYFYTDTGEEKPVYRVKKIIRNL